MSVAVFMASLDTFIVNIALLRLEADFSDAGVATLPWVLSASVVVFAALLVSAAEPVHLDATAAGV